uniref:Fumarate hydratase n=1 Tax=Alexandrium monilatum TaxID=311494 RepID=A0A6T1HKU4_9DINO
MPPCHGCFGFLNKDRHEQTPPTGETQAQARKRIRKQTSMIVEPGQSLCDTAGANLTEEFKRQISNEARSNAFLFDVNVTEELVHGGGACEKCVCGESAKSKDVEDMGPPKYDDFAYQPLFESVNVVDVPWTRLPELEKGVSVSSLTGPAGGSRKAVIVEPWVLRQLAERAISDVEHFLRPGHLAQLAKIMQDPEASDNDKFTANNLLQNAVIASKGILPGCQDTGTAICLGKKGQFVWTDEEDEMHLSHGIYDAYTKRNLRYSQVSPVSMFAEKNTKCNLPAQFDIYAAKGNEYKFMFMAKGGGSANKTYLFQQTKALLNPKSLEAFIAEKVVTLGTSACPPYHLAIVIGGLSAELCLKTVKLASARYLDDLPTSGNDHGRAYRDTKWEEKVLKMCHGFGIGAQYGGKYFVHDVRVIRMPRHGASCPVGIGVSCSADRQVLAKITDHGVFIEELEKNPARFLDQVGPCASIGGQAVAVNLNQPMKDILSMLSQHPIKTRLSLTGTIIVARDIAHAKLAERLEKEGSLPDYMGAHVVYYAGPAKTPEGYASGSFGPTTAGRMDTYVPLFQKHGYSMVTLAKGNRAKGVTDSCKKYGGFYLGSIGGAAANLAENCIKKVDLVEYEDLGMEAVWCIEVVDFPAFIIVDDKGNDFFADWKM